MRYPHLNNKANIPLQRGGGWGLNLRCPYVFLHWGLGSPDGCYFGRFWKLEGGDFLEEVGHGWPSHRSTPSLLTSGFVLCFLLHSVRNSLFHHHGNTLTTMDWDPLEPWAKEISIVYNILSVAFCTAVFRKRKNKKKLKHWNIIRNTIWTKLRIIWKII